MSIRLPVWLTIWLCFTITTAKAQVLQVEHLKNYNTVDTCFNKGVSAAFCGILNNKLIIAGGCNFPHTPAAEGGEKIFYNHIWATPLKNGTNPQWELIGKLPLPTAYGITIPFKNSLILIGGMTSGNNSLSHVIQLKIKNKKAIIEHLPSLPMPIDNATGAILGTTIYIAGGNANSKPSSTLFWLNLANKEKGWKSCSIPGYSRVQPISAVTREELYIFGGYTPKSNNESASMPTNGLKFNPQTRKWTELPAPTDIDNSIIALAGGASVALSDGRILCIGGVNQEIFPKALNGEYSGPSYMNHPKEWYKFNRKILIFNPQSQQWEIKGEIEAGARAGACLVNDGTWNYIINGELKPGIRTPMITRLKLK